MNIVDTLQIIVANMLIYSTPLIFTSIGGVFSERGDNGGFQFRCL